MRRAGFFVALLASCASPPAAAPIASTTSSASAATSATQGTPSPPPSTTTTASRRGAARTGSTAQLLSLRGRVHLALADDDERALRVVSVEGSAVTEVALLPLDSRLGDLVVAPDGRILCALRDAGVVAVIDWDDGLHPRVAARWKTEADPRALALTPDDATLLVASGAGQALEGFDLRSGERSFVTAIPRSARSLRVSRDGHHAMVTHAAGSGLTFVHLERGHEVETRHLELVRADLAKLKVPSSPLLHATGPVELGERLLVPGVVAVTGDTTVRTKDGYGHLGEDRLPAERFAIASVGALVEPLEETRLGRAGMLAESCLLPRAALLDEQKQRLLLACAGPGRVFSVDVSKEEAKERPSAPWAVPDGTNGLALDDETRRLFAWSSDDGALAVLDLDVRSRLEDAQVAPGGPAAPLPEHALHQLRVASTLSPEVRHGRALFFSTNVPEVSSDGRACASCHVDGGDDGLTWPTPEGPRNTPMLAGRLASTAPYGWSGKRATIEQHLKETLHRLGGRGLEGGQRSDLLAFLTTMSPPPRPVLEASLVDRGRALFLSPRTGCATCHFGDALTDRKPHDVKSRSTADEGAAFDTPSLLSVVNTAPYFHDGRYPTLRELLRGSDGTMGKTRGLSEDELAALEAYLRSL